jgi:hypothetical protein
MKKILGAILLTTVIFLPLACGKNLSPTSNSTATPTPTPFLNPNASWKIVGNAWFSAGSANDGSLGFNNGLPYVSYVDGANGSKATVMAFNGSNWVGIGGAGFSPSVAVYTSLAFSLYPYVAFVDNTGPSRATVMFFNGTTWAAVGSASFSSGSISYPAIAMNSAGAPYVAFGDGSNGYKSTVMEYTAAGATGWVTVGSAGFSAGQAFYNSLVFNGNTPYLAFEDYGNSQKATVMMYNGSAWVNVGNPGFSAGQALYISLAFNNNGQPYVSYADAANGQKATVMMYNGSSWVNVGNPDFSAGQVSVNIPIAFNNGAPYVAYADGGNGYKVTVMAFNGSSWVNVGNPGFSTGNVSSYDRSLSLAFNNGIPYVYYPDGVNGSKAVVMAFE